MQIKITYKDNGIAVYDHEGLARLCGIAHDNPYIPFPVVYKKFGVNGWEAHYIAVIIDNTEVILHEPLRK